MKLLKTGPAEGFVIVFPSGVSLDRHFACEPVQRNRLAMDTKSATSLETCPHCWPLREFPGSYRGKASHSFRWIKAKNELALHAFRISAAEMPVASAKQARLAANHAPS